MEEGWKKGEKRTREGLKGGWKKAGRGSEFCNIIGLEEGWKRSGIGLEED